MQASACGRFANEQLTAHYFNVETKIRNRLRKLSCLPAGGRRDGGGLFRTSHLFASRRMSHPLRPLSSLRFRKCQSRVWANFQSV